jgi:alpha-beta hydrolase superfamily lysophospholipase
MATTPETKWTIATQDGHTIYGVKNSSSDKATSAVFIVHGLTGNMHEYALKRAADYLSAQHDVYRLNLYDGEAGGRLLVDCTVQTHADDLNTVLAQFGGAYEKIFLIGHSYGGPTIMLARPAKITAVSLWDPSFDLRNIQSVFSAQYLEKDGYYVANWGTSYLIGKAMYEEAGRLDAEACSQLARDFGHPVQVIHAGDGFFINRPLSYHSFGNKLNRREVVAGTVHCFHEGNTCDELLAKTGEWFSQFD